MTNKLQISTKWITEIFNCLLRWIESHDNSFFLFELNGVWAFTHLSCLLAMLIIVDVIIGEA